ncbi:hypothetical protein [Flagellimonas marina]|uniref:Uncharacterized protein n=1 Tax=Flagellimonas marina TaxID=1775168 RepID=A0ABV8PJJ2_9FLAO
MKILNKIYSNMMMALTLAILIVTATSLTSCEDEDKNNLDDFLVTGGFVRFADQNPPTEIGVSEISDLSYSFEIEDANGTAASYDLKIYADLSGVRTDTLPVSVVTTFPSTFSFTADELASLVGVTVDEISFGDSFFFTAEVTTVTGVKYGGADRLDFLEVFPQLDGTYLDEDEDLVTVGPNDNIYTTAEGDTFLVGGQNMSDDFLDEAGYRQAYEFGFIILCPNVDMASLPGVYNVVYHEFDAFFGPQGDTRTVVAGPEANQITILGGAVPLDGADDLILTIDTTNSMVSYGGVDDEDNPANIHFNTFGPGTYDGVTGLVFTCIGKIDIQINSGGFIPNFLTLQK